MTYPDKLLAPGETLAFELKPHWRALIAPVIVLVIEVFVATWLFFSDNFGRCHLVGCAG